MVNKVAVLVRAALAAGLFMLPAVASADPLDVCASDRLISYDDISGIWAPCVTARGSVVAESTYLQNASATGGTALAAYPMVDLRTGIASGLEFAFHAPSQIAESGRDGIGLYPVTHLGYGLRYAPLDTSRLAVAVVTDVLPPVSRFSVNETQSRYLIGVTSAYEAAPKLLLGFAGSGTSSGTVGFAQVLPSEAFKAAYDFNAKTQLSTDIGTRFPARRSPQSFGDIAVNQTISKRFVLKVGAGTTFNPALDAKCHYLASGFNYRI